MINLSEVKVISAHEVELKELEAFYTEVYSDRSYSILDCLNGFIALLFMKIKFLS